MAVAVIGVLIGALAPALLGARRSAGTAACLSNLRQIAIAWGAYLADFDSFPVGRDETYFASVRFGWGGVHWYDDRGENWKPETSWLLTDDRPVNPYIGSDLRQEARAEIFRSPNDDGLTYYGTNDPVVWQKFAVTNDSGEGAETVFGQMGSSYEANDWLYCEPGAFRGMGFGGDPLPPFYRPGLGPRHVRVNPSRLVLVGDSGVMTAGRYPEWYRERLRMVHGWWHGKERGNHAFLDGSARNEVQGKGPAGETCCYWLAPDRHEDGGWWRATGP